jgi:hypothetical protein
MKRRYNMRNFEFSRWLVLITAVIKDVMRAFWYLAKDTFYPEQGSSILLRNFGTNLWKSSSPRLSTVTGISKYALFGKYEDKNTFIISDRFWIVKYVFCKLKSQALIAVDRVTRVWTTVSMLGRDKRFSPAVSRIDRPHDRASFLLTVYIKSFLQR